MNKKFNFEDGFSMSEFLVVIAIAIFLGGFITFNLTRTQQHTSVNTTIDELVSDIKEQQMKAMINDTEGRVATDTYGIYFQTTKYTLFHGNTYVANDTANFVINLDTNLQFINNTFPNTSIIFAKGSGEIVGFINGQNTITLKNMANNQTKTVSLNQYGTITGVN